MKRAFATLLVLGILAAIVLVTSDSWPIRFGSGSTDRVDAADGTADPSRADRERTESASPSTSSFELEGTIRGRVHDAEGAAVPGAKIRIIVQNDPVAREGVPGFSDEAGRFEIAASGGTVFTICADAGGFAPRSEPGIRIGDDVDLELVADPKLEGSVLDEQGRPVPGAAVSFLAVMGALDVERKTTSDADGRWSLSGLPTTTSWAWLLAKAPGFAPYRSSQLAGLMLTGTTSFTIVLRRGGTVTGKVVDSVTGGVIAGARLEVGTFLFGYHRSSTPRKLSTASAAVSDAEGNFRIECVPMPDSVDDFVLIGSAAGYARSVEQLPPVIDGGQTVLAASLWPAGSVEGRVVDAKGRPLPGTRVSVASWYSHQSRTLEGGPEGCLTGADGSYRLDGVPALSEGVKVAADRETGQRGWGSLDSVAVTRGKTTRAPDLVLKLAPAAVVRVLDPERRPLAGALVDVTASLPDMRDWFTGADGRVVVTFERDASQQGVPAFVRVTARGFVSVVPEAFIPDSDEPPVVDVVLARATELHGRVTWDDGTEAAGVPIGVARGAWPVAAVWPLRNETPPRDVPADLCLALAETDARGGFRFAGLPAAPWHVAAWLDAKDVEPAIRVESIADASQEVAIRLPEARPASRPAAEIANLEIAVVDAVSGKPVLDASVYADNRAALPAGLGIFRCAVPRGVVRVNVFSRDYAEGWERRIDASAPGNDRIEARLDPGIVLKGRARLPAGVSLTGAELSASWAGRGRRSTPLLPNGEFELRGVAAGVPLDLVVQNVHLAKVWNFVPMPYRPTVVPVGLREMAVDLEFAGASQVTLWLRGVEGHNGFIDPWDMTISGTSPAWSRSWQVPASTFWATLPNGSSEARWQVTGREPVSRTLDLNGDAVFLVILPWR